MRKNLFRKPFNVGRLGLFGFSILGYFGIPGSAETYVACYTGTVILRPNATAFGVTALGASLGPIDLPLVVKVNLGVAAAATRLAGRSGCKVAPSLTWFAS